jgi:dihydroorotase (multifunctional complex type)
VTTVIDMPNTGGGVVTPVDVAAKLAILEGRSHVDYGLYAQLADSAEHIADLCAAGIAGLKWMFGHEAPPSAGPVTLAAIRDTLARAGEAGLLVGVHAEDAAWHADLERRLREEGRTDVRAHGEARAPFVEALAIAQAATLTAEAGCRLHVHHLSSAMGLATATALRPARDAPLTVEVCPHHLLLTEDDLDRLGTSGRVNPPLRHAEDVAALWDGIAARTVDCIGSDHAPHAPSEKHTDTVWDAKSGLIGVETLLPLLLHEELGDRLSTTQLTRLTAETPAMLVALDHRKGALTPGHDADIVVVDPEGETVISSARLHSKHPETVFEGRRCRGSIDSVFLRGVAVARGGAVWSKRRGAHVRSRHRADSRMHGRLLKAGWR